MSKINVIKPSFTLIPDKYSPIQKVADMARICYRSESDGSPESDKKLIKACIKRGHTSVIEHGYMAVYFPDKPIDPKVFNTPQITQPISSQFIWSQFHTTDIDKYSELEGDDQIYKLIDGSNAPQRIYPVVQANFRAWLNIIDASLASAVTQQGAIAVAFVCGILVAANKEFPTIFGQLVESVNKAFSIAKPGHFLRKVFLGENDKKDVTLTIECLEKYYKHFGIVASSACPRASLSVILRTDRAVTHQLVRHRRDVAYSQESQRYCNYMNKGYDVIWPAVDPVKFEKAEFPSKPYVPEGTTESVVDQLKLEDSGFLPQKSSAFQTWLAAMDIAISHYENLLESDIVIPGDEKTKTVIHHLPPETARMVLPNSFATTIGVTWTPATFVNLMRWRLDSHAQWSIRCLLGNVVVEGLMQNHEFFENFLPAKIIQWLNQIHDAKILTNEQIFNTLIERQNKRQKNIEEAARRQQELIQKRMKEAAEAAAKKPDASTPKMGQPVGPGAADGGTPPAEKK